MGSKFARLAWGTKRKVRAAAPWETAGIERPPVAARLPILANPFNRVLRSIKLSQSCVAITAPPFHRPEDSAPNQSKRARQTMATDAFCVQMVCHLGRPLHRQDTAGKGIFRAIAYTFGLARELPELLRSLRMPPPAAAHDAVGHD